MSFFFPSLFSYHLYLHYCFSTFLKFLYPSLLPIISIFISFHYPTILPSILHAFHPAQHPFSSLPTFSPYFLLFLTYLSSTFSMILVIDQPTIPTAFFPPTILPLCLPSLSLLLPFLLRIPSSLLPSIHSCSFPSFHSYFLTSCHSSCFCFLLPILSKSNLPSPLAYFHTPSLPCIILPFILPCFHQFIFLPSFFPSFLPSIIQFWLSMCPSPNPLI